MKTVLNIALETVLNISLKKEFKTKYALSLLLLCSALFLHACGGSSPTFTGDNDTSEINSGNNTPAYIKRLFPENQAILPPGPVTVIAEFTKAIDSMDFDFKLSVVDDKGKQIEGETTLNKTQFHFHFNNRAEQDQQFFLKLENRPARSSEIEERSWSFSINTPISQKDFCKDFYLNTFALVDAEDNSDIPAQAQPAKGQTYTDQAYGTCIARATDHSIEAPLDFAGTDSARRQAFNADNTRFIIYSNDGFWHLYNATNLSYIKALVGPTADAEIQWHPRNPNLFFYTPDQGGMKIYEYNITFDQTRTVANFTGRLPWGNAARVWTGAKGSPSSDGRYWGFQVETKGFAPLGLIVWDAQKDELVGTWDFVENKVGRPYFTSMSLSGEYIVASWDNNPYGTTAFYRDFSSQVKLHHSSEHSDLALLPNGHDAYISVDYQSDDNMVFMHTIQTDTRTDLFPGYVNGTTTAFHFSGKAFDKPGWALVSTYGNTEPRQWLHEKIFAVELNANPRMLQIAHSQATEPRASVNRDFTRVIFNSNWQNDDHTDAYIITLPSFAIDDLGNSDTDTPPITPSPPPSEVSPVDIVNRTQNGFK